jgi:hypothetical protein
VCFFVSETKLRVRGYQFQTVEGVQKAVTDVIKPHTAGDIQSKYEELRVIGASCIESDGCYFEGKC